MASTGGCGSGCDGRPTAAACRIALLFMCLGLLASPVTPAAPDDGRKISPELAKRAHGMQPGDLIPVIVQTTAEPTDGHLVRLHGSGGVLKARHAAISGYSAALPAGVLEALAVDPEVERVSLDAPVRAFLDVAVKAVRLDVATADRPGIDGRGIGIAMIDTGVSLHADLQRQPGLARPIEVDFVGRDHGLEDPYGHGTHVAGVLNGSGLLSSGPDAFRTFRGIAPGARLISLRALRPDGTGQTSDVLTAIDWAIQHRRGYGIRILNLSVGHPVYESYVTDPLCRAARAAVAAGIVVVAAAGNDGRIGSGFGTIVSPANEPSVIAVGAMDDSGTAAREDDVLAPFSARGPSLVDHIVKPDLVAPGTFIVSLRAAGSVIDVEHHDLVLRADEYLSGGDGGRDGDYLVLSGTSLAAPMVAGAAALLLQQDASLMPADVKARLMASALRIDRLPFETGAGYLDVAAALESDLRTTSALSPRAVPGPDDTVVLEPLGNGWDGGWQQSLIWGGGRRIGTLRDSENDMVTGSGLVWGGGSSRVVAGGLVWGGGSSIVDSSGLGWGGGSSMVGASGLVWGGGSSVVGTTGLVWGGGSSTVGSEGDELVCTGIVWGGGH